MSRHRSFLVSRNHIGHLSRGKRNGTQEETQEVAAATEVSMDLSGLDGIFRRKRGIKMAPEAFHSRKKHFLWASKKTDRSILCASLDGYAK